MIALLFWLAALVIGGLFIEKPDWVWRILFWLEVKRLEKE
jgi:hypothetical protein